MDKVFASMYHLMIYETILDKVIMQGKLMQLRILYVHIETSSLWAEFVNKNRCISVSYPRRLKALNFDNFDNWHNSFLWPEYFIDSFMWTVDPMLGFDIRLVFTLPFRDSTLQYKRCVHLWNTFLAL